MQVDGDKLHFPSFYYDNTETWQSRENDWLFPSKIMNAGCTTSWGSGTQKYEMKWICFGGEYMYKYNPKNNYYESRLLYDIHSQRVWFDEVADSSQYDGKYDD